LSDVQEFGGNYVIIGSTW